MASFFIECTKSEQQNNSFKDQLADIHVITLSTIMFND